MLPRIQAFFDTATSTASYLVSDPATRTAAIIDPVLDYEPKAAKISTASADAILAAAADQNLKIAYVLETHAHADHLSAADHIRRRTGAKVAIGAEIVRVQETFAGLFETEVKPAGGDFDLLLKDGQVLTLGDLSVRVMHTPGHTPACVTYLIGDAAFVGDTLFMPDYGTARADFPGGDAAALYRSIHKILKLPPQTRVFVGHDYLPTGRRDFRWETTVAAERAQNVHAHEGVSEADFVALRRARDATLAPPTLILPSLQVNIRAGALPAPSAKGRVFLKLPVTVA
ncbi:MAG: MBL fold metallo-hydrolase [Proteobacteria bacterium]|nr:MBL fold metallo-hydrolase [Pseudomonadota bacterium]